MAEVYRSTLIGAEGFSRPVAVKRILGSFSSDPTFAEMFVNEANIASLLNHPNIVSVIDFDRDDKGQLFLVMELIEGADLKRLTEHARLPIPLVAFVVCEVLRALEFAHSLTQDGRSLGIVHRDVSPHNVLVSWDGAVKLSDFGIAKAAEVTSMTQSGLIKGKIEYMSPEQVEGARLDGRSDLFAVGILLHELLTGRRLFGGAPDRVVLNRILIAPIDPPSKTIPDVPRRLDEICMKLLERELDRRYQRAEEAIEDLLSSDLISPRAQLDLARLMKERLRDGKEEIVTATLSEPVSTKPALEPTRTSTGAPLAPPAPKRCWPIALAFLACIGAIVAVRFSDRDDPSPPEIRAEPISIQTAAPPPPPPPPPAETKVRITSNPSGALVHLDGSREPVGRTPFELSIKPGEVRRIELKLDGHRSTTHELRGEDLHVEMAALTPPKKRKKKVRDGILPPEKRIGDGILRPNL